MRFETFCSQSYDFLRKYSTQVQQGAIVALDTVFLAGKLSRRVPEKVTKSALTALSFMSIVNAPTTLDMAIKFYRDIHSSLKARLKLLAYISGFKLTEVIANFNLAILSLVGATVGLANEEEAQKEIYERLIIPGEIILCLTALLELLYIHINKKALSAIEQQTVPFEDILNNLDHQLTMDNEAGHIAVLVRASMDQNTLRELIEGLKKIRLDQTTVEELRKIIRDNIKTELKYDQYAQITLLVLGYTAMIIEKYNTPNSVVSASINLGFATAQGGILLREACKEAGQRKGIAELLKGILEYQQVEQELMSIEV